MIHWTPVYSEKKKDRENQIRSDDESRMNLLSVRMQTSRLVDKTRSVSFTFYPSHMKFKLHVLFSFSLSLASLSFENIINEKKKTETFFFLLIENGCDCWNTIKHIVVSDRFKLQRIEKDKQIPKWWRTRKKNPIVVSMKE